jgi:hypothetical protein
MGPAARASSAWALLAIGAVMLVLGCSDRRRAHDGGEPRRIDGLDLRADRDDEITEAGGRGAPPL